MVTCNLWVTTSLYKKECLPVITWNKKHSSKQVVSILGYLGKTFLHLPLLKVYETFLFRQSKKVGGILWSVRVLFAFLEKRGPKRQDRNSPKNIEGANKQCRPPWLGDEENSEKSSLSNGL